LTGWELLVLYLKGEGNVHREQLGGLGECGRERHREAQAGGAQELNDMLFHLIHVLSCRHLYMRD
jgi:hypothetical protein